MFFMPATPLKVRLTNREDQARQQVYILRYKCYQKYIEPQNDERLTDRFDSDGFVFVYEEDKTVLGTIRLTVGLDLPINNVFNIQSNFYDAEISKFAIDEKLSAKKKFNLGVSLIRSCIVGCKVLDINNIYVASLPRTMPLYTRVCGFKSMNRQKIYPPSKDVLTLLNKDFKSDYAQLKEGSFFHVTGADEEDFTNEIKSVFTKTTLG